MTHRFTRLQRWLLFGAGKASVHLWAYKHTDNTNTYTYTYTYYTCYTCYTPHTHTHTHTHTHKHTHIHTIHIIYIRTNTQIHMCTQYMLYTSIYTQTQNPCEFASVSGAIMTIIKLFLPFPPLFRRGVKVVSDIRCVCGQGSSHASVHDHVYAHMHHVYGYCRYATESTKTSQPQDADTQPGWAKLPPMGSIWGVKIQV